MTFGQRLLFSVALGVSFGGWLSAVGLNARQLDPREINQIGIGFGIVLMLAAIALRKERT